MKQSISQLDHAFEKSVLNVFRPKNIRINAKPASSNSSSLTVEIKLYAFLIPPA